MQKDYQLTRDPVYFFMVAFFALLTTGFPAVLGQPRFLPIVQAVALTVFIAIPLRRGDFRAALGVVYLWLALAMATVFALTWLAPAQVARAFDDDWLQRLGWQHAAYYSEWYYANSVPLPASFADQPIYSLLEVVGVTLGTLLTGGLVGAWFLVKLANLAAFSAAGLLSTLGNPLLLPIALPVWSILQIVGGGGLLVLLAEPIYTPGFGAGVRKLFGPRRRLLLIFGGLYLLGVILELVLPPFWHFTRVT